MAQGSAHTQLRAAITEDWVRAVVREEIVKAFGALAREAQGLDVPYDTDREDSNVYRLITRAAEGAAQRLTCEHEEYFPWAGGPRCSDCDEPQPQPADPFKEETDGTS